MIYAKGGFANKGRTRYNEASDSVEEMDLSIFQCIEDASAKRQEPIHAAEDAFVSGMPRFDEYAMLCVEELGKGEKQ